jgi:dTDP-4-amino-4,6-dideoxygalactose transaminase
MFLGSSIPKSQFSPASRLRGARATDTIPQIYRGGVSLMEAAARAGTERRIPLMDLTREFQAHRRELLGACEHVLARMHLLGGDEVRAFEREMAAYLDAKHVTGVASGTDALLLSILASGIRPGDEVLLQANAFVAAVEALHRAGVVPVPVDVRTSDLGPDPDALAAAVGPRTRGILVVHLYGLPVVMDPIVALAEKRGLVLLEDCSHAHGARLHGRSVGTFGRAGAFSLGVVKNLAAYGDAGIVSTNDAALAERVKLLGTHGQAKKNEHVLYGTNSRLDELQAAMLRVKLRALDERNARRAAIARYYGERLAAHVTPPPADPARTHVYHQYVIRTPQRDALRKHLGEHGIDTGVHYPVPIHRQPAWLAVYGESPAMPRAEEAARQILSLPVHADLTDEEVETVTDCVVGFYRR